MELEEILEQLKEAVLNNDMDSVANVYELITGEKIVREKPPEKKDLRTQLQLKMKSVRGDNSPAILTPPPDPVQEQPRPSRGKVQAGKMRFVDERGCTLDEHERAELEEAKKELENKGKKPFVKTRRPPVNLVKATCKKCNRVYEISPQLVTKIGDGVASFVCNSCIVES